MARIQTRWFFDHAFTSATLIEAANEREEATAVAIALKLALERPVRGRASQAALITPDRGLARRVATELKRFGIIADDSAGTPLSATPQAGLVQLVLEAVLRPGDPVSAVSLLKHPLARFGLSKDAFEAAATALELIALRGGRLETEIGNLEAVLDAQLLVQRMIATHRNGAPHCRTEAWKRPVISPDESRRQSNRFSLHLSAAAVQDVV